MVIVVWGVSGCGKTTVGQLLASSLNWQFFDADDFHPPENIEKMREGMPLDDSDRYPWLRILAALVKTSLQKAEPCVLACSALKAEYRDLLGIDEIDVCSVHLTGTRELVAARLRDRKHQFMDSNLLASQYATLEPATTGLKLDIMSDPEDLVRQICKHFQLV